MPDYVLMVYSPVADGVAVIEATATVEGRLRYAATIPVVDGVAEPDWDALGRACLDNLHKHYRAQLQPKEGAECAAA